MSEEEHVKVARFFGFSKYLLQNGYITGIKIFSYIGCIFPLIAMKFLNKTDNWVLLFLVKGVSPTVTHH